nr:angiopoietin-1-like [Lytechinus pictus]
MEGQRNEVKRATRYSRALEEQECEVVAVREHQPRNPTIDKIVKAVIDALDERDRTKETQIRTKYQESRKNGVEPQRTREEPNKSKIDEQEEQRCFNCNGLGHWRKNCPYPKKMKGGTAAFQVSEREVMSEIKEKKEQIRVGTTLDGQEKRGTEQQTRVGATLDGQEKRRTKEQEKEEQTRVGATLDIKRKGLYLQGRHAILIANLRMMQATVRKVMQRRYDGSVNIERPWGDYKHGFGSLSTEFWLGNELIHELTSLVNYRLCIEMMHEDGTTSHSKYQRFRVESEGSGYRLHVLRYDGGDAASDAFGLHDGYSFSTVDRENNLRQVEDRKKNIPAKGFEVTSVIPTEEKGYHHG